MENHITTTALSDLVSPSDLGSMTGSILDNSAQHTESAEFTEIMDELELSAGVIDELRDYLPEEQLKTLLLLFADGKQLPQLAGVAAKIEALLKEKGDSTGGELLKGVVGILKGDNGMDMPLAAAVKALSLQADGSTPSQLPGQSPLDSQPILTSTPIPTTIPPGSKEWDSAVGDRILWMVGQKNQNASIPITPPHQEQLKTPQLLFTDGNQLPQLAGVAAKIEAILKEKGDSTGRELLKGVVGVLKGDNDKQLPQLAGVAAKIEAILKDRGDSTGGELLKGAVGVLKGDNGMDMSLTSAVKALPLQANGSTLSQLTGQSPLDSQSVRTSTPIPITIPPGSKEWGSAVGDRVLWMVGQKSQSASIRITPPHLGPIEVHVTVQKDQASVNITALHAVVKDALETAIPRLREMFNDNNLQLVNVDVSQKDAGDQQPMQKFSKEAGGEQVAADGDQADHSGVEDDVMAALQQLGDGGRIDYYI